jgi:hypothetical protein
MNEQLVAKSLIILEVFCAQNNIGGVGKNEILRDTGSKDKPVIFKTINFLKKANILEFKRVKQGKKAPVTLTRLGKEIVDLIIDIKKSKDTYLAVKDKILEYIRFTEDSHKILESMRLFKVDSNHNGERDVEIWLEELSKKGWKEEMISDYTDLIQSLFRIRDFYRKNIYNSLIYRYHTISNFGVNENAKEVLIKIIINAITNFLTNELTLNMTHSRFSDNHHQLENLSKPIMEEIEKIYMPVNPRNIEIISNRFTSEAIADLMSSLVCILKPAKEDFAFTRVKSQIEKMKKSFKSENREYIPWISQCYLNNLEDLARLRGKCVTRYGDYLDGTDEV